MNPAVIHTRSGLSELKLFLALSRTPHGLLDMATPALAALLWLGAPAGSRFAGIAVSLAAGITLLIIPAYRLCRTRGRTEALALFNSASYYPLTLLAAAVIAACP